MISAEKPGTIVGDGDSDRGCRPVDCHFNAAAREIDGITDEIAKPIANARVAPDAWFYGRSLRRDLRDRYGHRVPAQRFERSSSIMIDSFWRAYSASLRASLLESRARISLHRADWLKRRSMSSSNCAGSANPVFSSLATRWMVASGVPSSCAPQRPYRRVRKAAVPRQDHLGFRQRLDIALVSDAVRQAYSAEKAIRRRPPPTCPRCTVSEGRYSG